MKVTAQEEYGVRCILQLARLYSEKPVSGRQISDSEGLSLDYVSKLMMILRRANLVASIRGINGGYTLAREPQKITLGQAMRALSTDEGIVLTSPESQMCDHFSGHLENCVHLNACAIRPVWNVLSRYLSSMMDHITLTDLLQDETNVYAILDQVSQHTIEEQRQEQYAGGLIKLDS